MSKASAVPLSDLKEWLENETTHIVEPLKTRGEGFAEDVKGLYNEIVDVCTKFLKDSEREMGKENPKTYRRAKRAYRFSKKALESVEGFAIPEEISSQTLKALAESFEDTLKVVENQRRQWFPKISPYFFFDRRRLDFVFRKAVQLHQQLREFVLNDFKEVKQVEEALLVVDDIIKQRGHLAKVKERVSKMEVTEKDLQANINKVSEEITSIKGETALGKLEEVNERIEALSKKVLGEFRHLKKPLLKFRNYVQNTSSNLSPKEAGKLSAYITDPFEALASENERHPSLRKILQSLDEALNKKMLKLKSSRNRKARMQIRKILEKNGIERLHQDCRDALAEKETLQTSSKVSRKRSEVKQLREKLETLRTRKATLDSKKAFPRSNIEKIADRIRAQKAQIEDTVAQLTGNRISVKLD